MTRAERPSLHVVSPLHSEEQPDKTFRTYFANPPPHVWRISRIGASLVRPTHTKYVLIGIAEHINHETWKGETAATGMSFPSVDTIAEWIAGERSVVMDHIAHAEKEGWLVVKRRGRGRSNHYFIQWHRLPYRPSVAIAQRAKELKTPTQTWSRRK